MSYKSGVIADRLSPGFSPWSGFVAHLKLLAKITKLLHTRDIFEEFMSATSKVEAFRILLEAERINIKPLEEIYT